MFDKLKQLFAVKKPSIAMPRPAGATFPALWKSETFEAMARQILSMPDPDAILRKAGIRRTTLKKLLYDDEIYQAVSTRLDGLSIVPVRLEPTETKESKFIQTRCLTQEFLKVILAGAFDARLYGYSVMEIIWDKESYDYERVFVPKDISRRNIDYFIVRPDGTLVQMLLAGVPGVNITVDPILQRKLEDVSGAMYTAIVMDTKFKFLLTRNSPTWENPYGEALLSRLWWPWFFRQKTWNFYGQYLERYAIPLLVGHSEDPSQLAEVLARAQQDSVMAVNMEDKIEAVNVNSYGHSLYQEAEDMLIRRIEKLILGQTLTSGTDGGSGNRALGQVHNIVREDKVKSDIELVKSTVQNFVNACFFLNGFRGDPPEVIFGDDRELAIERAKRDAILIQHGIVGGFSEDYLMDNYGFRPGEFTMPVEPKPFTPGIEEEEDGKEEEEKEDAPGKEIKASAGAFAARKHPKDLEIEALALWATRKAGSPTNPREIKAAILESDSAMELMDRLAKLETRPDFAGYLLDVNESAVAMGGKENRKSE